MNNNDNLKLVKSEEHPDIASFKDKLKTIFKKASYSADDIYEMLYKYVNFEKNKYALIEQRSIEIKNRNLKANEEISNLHSLIENQEQEIINQRTIILNQEQEILRLTDLLHENDNDKKRLFEYLDKVAMILQNNQKKIINRKKPTKADFIAESMYKIEKETKEKLK